MRSALILALTYISTLSSFAQINWIQSGPMNGYSTMREVAIWIQTTQSATVQLEYWPIDERNNSKFSTSVQTQKISAYSAHLLADEIEPGTTYSYSILVNNERINFNRELRFESQPLWQHRTAPPALKIAVGSCAYINEQAYDRPTKPYGSNYPIFETIHKNSPNAMVWLGDNTYLREADYDSKTGIYKRHTHTRSLPELQKLLSSTHHYAIWDDHDYGPNDADRSYPLKDITLQAFKDFWANPSYGINNQPGTTSMFQFYDIDFFLLDNRYYRTNVNRTTGERFILGDSQIE